MSIETLLNQPIAGDAFSDGSLHDQLHLVAMDVSVPLALRAAAIRKIDEIIGYTPVAVPDEQLVTEYMAELDEDRITPES